MGAEAEQLLLQFYFGSRAQHSTGKTGTNCLRTVQQPYARENAATRLGLTIGASDGCEADG